MQKLPWAGHSLLFLISRAKGWAGLQGERSFQVVYQLEALRVCVPLPALPYFVLFGTGSGLGWEGELGTLEGSVSLQLYLPVSSGKFLDLDMTGRMF